MRLRLLLAALMILCGAQSRLSAQSLTDIEISAGYCLGVLDTTIMASQAWEKSHRTEVETEMEGYSKAIMKYQQIERHRSLTKLEHLDYNLAKSHYDALKQMLSTFSLNKEYRSDRERIRSYLMAKGFFSPSRALDFPALLASINRG